MSLKGQKRKGEWRRYRSAQLFVRGVLKREEAWRLHSGALTISPQQPPGKQQREDGMQGDGWPQKRTAPPTTHSHISEVQRNEHGVGQHSD
jgi:hypothetical protein